MGLAAPDTQNPKPRPSALSIFGTAAIALLVLNALLLGTGSGPLPTGVQTFYWQRYNGYLFWPRFWGAIAAPICVLICWIIFFRRHRKPEVFAVLLGAACCAGLCLCINYWALFVSGFVDNTDSITFNGNTYQLVEYDHYDDSTRVFLGKCDASGFQCLFWEFYLIDWCPNDCSPHFAFSQDAKAIMVKFRNHVVYTYDGLHGNCSVDPMGVLSASACFARP